MAAQQKDGLLLCYNKGCAQKYDPANNNKDSCVYHSGKPVFHDAYKSWSCCNMKSTDFSQFLNFKGCTVGPHSNVKPVEDKPKESSPITKEVYKYEAPPTIKPPTERPSEDQPLIKLTFSVGASLKPWLDKLDLNASKKDNGEEQKEIAPGTCCKNSACTQVYPSTEQCFHHPGVAVFHEGMKFWTCCMKKTSDFDKFLSQEACTYGEHLWIKKSTDPSNQCRHDWHQTGSDVYLTIYSKYPIPQLSFIEVNPVHLKADVVYGEDRNPFNLDITLFGVIDPSQSRVSYFSTKVEIKMKKAEPQSWKTLAIKSSKDLSNKLSDMLIN